MVQGLAPALGRLDEDPQVALGLLLADEFGQGLRAQGAVAGGGDGFVGLGFAVDDPGLGRLAPT
jgi:hypothetical protein